MRGRVVAHFGRRYRVAPDPEAAPDAQGAHAPAPPGAEGAEVDAIARGRGLDIVVGDRVRCAAAQGVEVIEEVEPRRTLLYRADAQRTQPLAANIDQVAIVFAARPTPQVEFLWRALLAARAAGIEALAVLNKADLESAQALADLAQIETLGARTLRVSARQDPAAARAALAQACTGHATLFVGQSGMGKSTLLGLLLDAQLRTGELSRRGTHGRQTTTATRWYPFGPDGAVLDSPGFHAFGLSHLGVAALVQWMPDFAPFADQCRFADCQHHGEQGCAIAAALAHGQISAARHAFYQRLLAEASAGRTERTRPSRQGGSDG